MKYRTVSAVFNRHALSILLLATFLGMFAGHGCHGAAHTLLPDTGGKLLTLPKFVGGIMSRSADLNYITEQDSEVFAFYRNAAVKGTTEEAFLGLLRRPPESQIIRQSWSAFFQLRTQNDPTGRWGYLQQYLAAHLTDRTVFRIPREAPYDSQYDLYAIGLWDGRTVVGIQMFGVAT